MINPTLQEREDGFIISKAKSKEFPVFKKLVEELPDEIKQNYSPWMFEKNVNLKIKLGQILVKLSLIPPIGKMIKKIFPYGYGVILKCENSKGELAGLICMYNFKRLPKEKYSVTESKLVFEKFQNLGLGEFLTESFIDVAKKENVGTVISGTRTDNIKNKKIYQKYGWKLKLTIPDGFEYKGKSFDYDFWYLELN